MCRRALAPITEEGTMFDLALIVFLVVTGLMASDIIAYRRPHP